MKSRTRYSVTWEEAPVWLRILGTAALVNFFTFWIGVVLLGGDAVNGRIQNGHYFLRSHAHLQEVSAGIFIYSEIHCISAMVGMVATMLAVVWFKSRRA